MSIDRLFSPLDFPRLRRPEDVSVEHQGRVRGHAAGYAAGLRAAADEVHQHLARLDAEHAEQQRLGRERLAQAVEALEAAAQAATVRLLPVLAETQDKLADSAFDLAEAILGHELADGERSARSAITRALAGLDPADVQVIRMNPADLAMLEQCQALPAGVKLQADASLGRGDAVTRLPDGYLDARIGNALERARAALLEGPC